MHMPPPVHGAAMMGKYIHDSKLINESFECHYINPSASKSVANVGKVNFRKILFMISNIFNIISTVKRLAPNLCYYTPTADGWGIYRDMIVIFILKMMKQKIILHMHNKGVKNFSERSKMSHIAYSNILKNIKVILLAKELYPDVAQYVPMKNIYFCPNGMPVTNKCNYIRKGIHQPYTFIFLSNMIKEKGVIDLLEACSILKKRNIPFLCNFVGHWSDITEKQFQTLSKKMEIESNVCYLGPKYADEKAETLKSADALVFPSYYHGETFGLVLLEAMEYYMPCISTQEGGIPSVIDDGKTGFIINARDITTLADKMQWLVENPQQGIKMGYEGKKKFLKEFTLDTFEKNMYNILKQV